MEGLPIHFSALVNRHVQQVNLDDQDNEGVSTSGSWVQISIKHLFNFQSTDWASQYGYFANLSYELELYDLLEKDTDGEIDSDIDGTTQEVLLT